MKQEAHLFVLCHGLWGGANHLKSIDDLIQLNLVDSPERVCTLRPRTSSLFKTYDGVEIIAHRMLLEVLEEINRLGKEDDMRVCKISFIGYSLGGVVARYIIGELEKIGLFDVVEPMFFATFATPHLGVRFFRKRFGVFNFMLSNVFGRVGAELAIQDDDKMLVKLTEGEYYAGLKKFKHRFCFANIRHDRTVNFFTAYITDKNPFDEHWDKLDLSFNFEEDIISTYNVRGLTVQPKIVNLKDSAFQPASYKKKSVPLQKKLRYVGIIIFLSFFLPIWIPIALTASTIGSLVSALIVKTYKKHTYEELKKLVAFDHLTPDSSVIEKQKKRKESDTGTTLRERLDEATSEAFENAINIGQYDTRTDSTKDDNGGNYKQLFTIAVNKSSNLIRNVNSLFEGVNDDDYEIFQETKALPLDEDRQVAMERLNSLGWHKFAVYINVLNAHDGIVARKGLKRGTIKGVAVAGFFTELLNAYIAKEEL